MEHALVKTQIEEFLEVMSVVQRGIYINHNYAYQEK
jgi:hypothetical protein